MSRRDLSRPNPDELLRRIEVQEGHEARGRLKIFLGFAPRVGKSLRMFEEGARRRERGQDVVVGAIQNKGSGDLETLIGRLEVIPPLPVGDSDAMNIDAIIARRPTVCLVDELARDNPPGSRHQHRWEDVEELRGAGINVVAAINLQHVRELQDSVEKITGKRARKAVPECFINSADEIVVVDLPVDTFEKQSGGRGGSNVHQLSQLRELALLLAAEVVEHELQRYMDAHAIMQSWGTQERILICMTPRSSAREMLNSGARAASRFHAQLLAITVKGPADLERPLEEALNENLEYARKLGAEVYTLSGSDAVGEIIRFAREQRITQVFIGHTQQPKWKIWAPNPVDRFVSEAEGMDVRIFPHASSELVTR